MDIGRGRVTSSRTGVVAGSVWESRMKLDEVKGGIKVFNAEQNTDQNADQNPTITTTTTTSTNNNELQVYKRLRPKQGLAGVTGKRKTWKSDSPDGFEKSPIQIAKQGSKDSKLTKNLVEQGKELSLSADGIKKSPIPIKKTRSVFLSQSDGIERNLIPLRKEKSEVNKDFDEIKKSLNDLENEVERNLDEMEGSVEEIEKYSSGEIKSGSDEIVVCEEKVITSKLSNVGLVKEDWDEEIDQKGCDVKEISIQEQNQKKVMFEEKIIQPNIGKPVPISPILRKLPSPVLNKPRIVPKPTITKPISVSDECKRVPRTHNKLQSLVDLVMWRDVSKSAFVFGIGTFLIISSSYTSDLNISFISVVSYLGLVYLAAIFFFRSIILRGAVDIDDTRENHVFGEEEAIWLLRLILPYMNEFLLKLRALFSGDPSTTMKLAVLLFILARCGSSITIWKMAKLGFFGVFTLPKVCSSYSTQLTAYGTFWIQRFRDAWESCAHKKAVAFAIFTLVWNLSSIIARIWAVFMLFVAFRYYKHSLMSEESVEEDAIGGEDSWQGQSAVHRQRRGTNSVQVNKQKKRY